MSKPVVYFLLHNTNYYEYDTTFTRSLPLTCYLELENSTYAECKFVRSMEILQLEIYSICKLQLFDRNYNLTMKLETGCRNLGSVVQNLAKDEQRCCIRIHFNTCQTSH